MSVYEERLWRELEHERRVAEALAICDELRRLLVVLRFELARARLQSNTEEVQ
jgi:hypothetical protein